MEKIRFAVIGGTGLEGLSEGLRPRFVKTPYGTVKSLFLTTVAEKKVAVLTRHGPKHAIPPHRVNYRANIYALHKLGVEDILATNAVGGIANELEPGDMLVPDDFIDFTKLRATTFFDRAPVTHVDFSEPYCPRLRRTLTKEAEELGIHVSDHGVLACTEGPRYETPAEIEMFRRLGCDIVGMTGFPEVALARELEICYATICYVSNRAAGRQERLATTEVARLSKAVFPKIEKILTHVLKSLAYKRARNCACSSALKNARFG